MDCRWLASLRLARTIHLIHSHYREESQSNNKRRRRRRKKKILHSIILMARALQVYLKISIPRGTLKPWAVCFNLWQYDQKEISKRQTVHIFSELCRQLRNWGLSPRNIYYRFADNSWHLCESLHPPLKTENTKCHHDLVQTQGNSRQEFCKMKQAGSGGVWTEMWSIRPTCGTAGGQN